MANIKSAKKRSITNLKSKLRNKSIKTGFRTIKKSIVKSLEGSAIDTAQLAVQFEKFQKSVDKAVTKNVVKKNTAARWKSRLHKKIAQASNAK